MFQRVGATAFKKDLTNTLALCETLGNPQRKFPAVHVAGTNGKGSTSHMLAAILQKAGYNTGLYTSPHLKDFTERIKVNGRAINQQFVVKFVNQTQHAIESIKPSFFEITVAMAFQYFAEQQVDIAIVETGLGGRLDSTNVITPVLSVITNISFDHKDLLGDSLPAIAFEKAGIIKAGVPVVISESQPEVSPVFVQRATELGAALIFADEYFSFDDDRVHDKRTNETFSLVPDLKGAYQKRNIPGVMAAVEQLRACGFTISREAVISGIENTSTETGLKGRWQKLASAPLTICDVGHNEAGIKQVVQQIYQHQFDKLWMVVGFVKDKDLTRVLQLLPRHAYYFFCQANIPRAMNASDLLKLAEESGLVGEAIPDVNDALTEARRRANVSDFIFIGGSTFVVAEIDEL